jgi:hypothetical protein
MITKRILGRNEALVAAVRGEFAPDIIHAAPLVIVVMTQDWCGQWVAMRQWLYAVETPNEVLVCELIYNGTDFYEEFMAFKERVFGNHHVPYLRVYRNGILSEETNYISRSRYEQILAE